MADSKLTDLTATTAIDGTELVYVIEDPSGTPLDRKVTATNLVRGVGDGTYLSLADAVTDYEGKDAARSPSAASLTWTERTGLATVPTPRSVGVDDYVYGDNGSGSSNRIVRSNDGFATVSNGVRFSDLGDTNLVVYVTKIDEGWVAVTRHATVATDVANVYFGTSFTDINDWDLILTCGYLQPISIGDPVSTAGGTVWTIGEYGDQASRELYAITWTAGVPTVKTIFTHTRVDIADQTHCHGSAYDEVTDQIWASFGDGVNARGLGYTDDWRTEVTPNWTWIGASQLADGDQLGDEDNKPTVVHPTSKKIVVTPDGSFGNIGVWGVDRNTERIAVDHEAAPVMPYTLWARRQIGRSVDGDEVYILFQPAGSTAGAANQPLLVIAATGDGGETWHQLHSQGVDRDADFYSGGIVGPDAAGRLFLYGNLSGLAKDPTGQTPASGHHLYYATAPSWKAQDPEPIRKANLDPRIPSVEEARAVNLLTSGQETIPRMDVVSSLSTASQGLRLTYFTARKTEVVASMKMITSGTAAAATPTLCRMGLYLVDDSGDLTLVASTPNDTTLFAATHTPYTKALSASYAVARGQRYAWGVLVVSGATMPAFHGLGPFPGSSAEHAVAPRLAGQVTGQADLPATIASGSVSNSGSMYYGVLLP